MPEYYPEDREDYESVPEVAEEEIYQRLADARSEDFRCRYCEKNIGRGGYCDDCIDELDLQTEDVRPLTVLTPTTTTNHEAA